MGEAKRKRQAEAARQTGDVVHEAKRKPGAYKDAEARKAYRREWMAARRTVVHKPAAHGAVVHEAVVHMIHKPAQPPVIEEEVGLEQESAPRGALSPEVATETVAPGDIFDLGTRLPAWTTPQVIELDGATAIIRRSYARFSPDHPCHRHESDYAPDYTNEGARVLTWRPPVTSAPVMRMAA
jgi:hypothetical protein